MTERKYSSGRRQGRERVPKVSFRFFWWPPAIVDAGDDNQRSGNAAARIGLEPVVTIENYHIEEPLWPVCMNLSVIDPAQRNCERTVSGRECCPKVLNTSLVELG